MYVPSVAMQQLPNALNFTASTTPLKTNWLRSTGRFSNDPRGASQRTQVGDRPCWDRTPPKRINSTAKPSALHLQVTRCC